MGHMKNILIDADGNISIANAILNGLLKKTKGKYDDKRLVLYNGKLSLFNKTKKKRKKKVV